MPADETEIFIALVAALGTDITMVGTELKTELTSYEFTTVPLRVSEYFADLGGADLDGLLFDERLDAAMTAGDELRGRWRRGDALALAAINDIVATRKASTAGTIGDGEDAQPINLDRTAFVIRSLKTPDELSTLRAVYGPRLFVIAAYSPEDVRIAQLAQEIRDSRGEPNEANWAHQPIDLIKRDMDEELDGGQNVSDTFHRADFFIRAWNRDVARTDIVRSLEVIFGHPFHTPTRDERAQFVAAGEARRSAEPGRQVGAAIARPDGAIVALGTNEVPRFGGGSFSEGDDRVDNREFAQHTIETNKRHQQEMAQSIATNLGPALSAALEASGISPEQATAVRNDLDAQLPSELLGAGLKDITEFGRAVHAEMDALLDAARRGVAVQGCTAHTTTFPCHNCARHLIAAGIERVVFVEPYAKSKAADLHDDSMALDASGVDGKVSFEPFVGVAPRRYLDYFDATARERLARQPRKADDGTIRTFDKATAIPLFTDSVTAELRPLFPSYRQRELVALGHFADLLVADSTA